MAAPGQPPRFLDQVRARARARHYSRRTEDTYVAWIRRFILFHGRRHPRDLNARDVSDFLTHLATDRHVAASTQNQALGALLFLYRGMFSSCRSNRSTWFAHASPLRLPEVLSRPDVGAVIRKLDGVYGPRWAPPLRRRTAPQRVPRPSRKGTSISSASCEAQRETATGAQCSHDCQGASAATTPRSPGSAPIRPSRRAR